MTEFLQGLLIALAIIVPIFLITNGFKLPAQTNEEAPMDMDMSHSMHTTEGHDMGSQPEMGHGTTPVTAPSATEMPAEMDHRDMDMSGMNH